jgi:hypothetical protein
MKTLWHKPMTLWGSVLLIVCTLGCLFAAAGPDPEGVAILKDMYGYTNWVGQTKINYSHAVTNWTPDFARLGISNDFVRSFPGQYTNGNKSSVFFIVPTNDVNTIVKLTVYERSSVTNAHEAMIERYTEYVYGNPFSLGVTTGVDIGDRCYVKFRSGKCVYLSLVRNNIQLTLSCLTSNAYSVVSIGEELDGQLVKSSVED